MLIFLPPAHGWQRCPVLTLLLPLGFSPLHSTRRCLREPAVPAFLPVPHTISQGSFNWFSSVLLHRLSTVLDNPKRLLKSGNREGSLKAVSPKEVPSNSPGEVPSKSPRNIPSQVPVLENLTMAAFSTPLNTDDPKRFLKYEGQLPRSTHWSKNALPGHWECCYSCGPPRSRRTPDQLTNSPRILWQNSNLFPARESCVQFCHL